MYLIFNWYLYAAYFCFINTHKFIRKKMYNNEVKFFYNYIKTELIGILIFPYGRLFFSFADFPIDDRYQLRTRLLEEVRRET